MALQPRTVRVQLAARSYDIVIGDSVRAQLGVRCEALGLGKRCAIIVDRNVAPLLAQSTEKGLRAAGFEPVTITVPAGETAKSLSNVHRCYDQLAAHRLERKSFIVALG